MKAYEKIEKTIYQPVRNGGSGKLGKLITIGGIAYGAYTLYKKFTNEEKYPEFDNTVKTGSSFDDAADEEEKFAEKILKAAKKAGKDVEDKFDKIKKAI